MKRNQTKDDNPGEINITPMLDVVFIMLIFFIVTTSFAKETGIGISRASSTSDPNPDAKIITIKLDPEGHSINGNTVTLGGIEARMAQLKAQFPELQAQLMAAKGIKIKTLVHAVEQVRNAEVDALSVSTY